MWEFLEGFKNTFRIVGNYASLETRGWGLPLFACAWVIDTADLIACVAGPAHTDQLRSPKRTAHLEFQRLPFGLINASRVFTKLLKLVMALLRKRGIRTLIFLDDMLYHRRYGIHDLLKSRVWGEALGILPGLECIQCQGVRNWVPADIPLQLIVESGCEEVH